MERILKALLRTERNTILVLDFRKHIIRFIFIAYALLLSYELLLGSERFLSREMLISNRDIYLNLIPFKTITRYFEYFSYFKFWDWVSNMFGNVLIFIPIGMLFPLATEKKRRFLYVLSLSLLMILVIEITQHLFGLGVFDVDDIILNFCGVIIGYPLYKGTSKLITKN